MNPLHLNRRNLLRIGAGTSAAAGATLSAAGVLPLILPGMIPHFFTGGTAGVFGNATGGRRGAVAGGFINGLIITLFAAFLVPVMSAIGFQNTTFGDMLDVWRAADEIELFESAWTFDHFYPIFSDPTGPCLEGWVTTTALASGTYVLRVEATVGTSRRVLTQRLTVVG